MTVAGRGTEVKCKILMNGVRNTNHRKGATLGQSQMSWDGGDRGFEGGNDDTTVEGCVGQVQMVAIMAG